MTQTPRRVTQASERIGWSTGSMVNLAPLWMWQLFVPQRLHSCSMQFRAEKAAYMKVQLKYRKHATAVTPRSPRCDGVPTPICATTTVAYGYFTGVMEIVGSRRERLFTASFLVQLSLLLTHPLGSSRAWESIKVVGFVHLLEFLDSCRISAGYCVKQKRRSQILYTSTPLL